MDEIKKCCENCEYFFQHYGWIANKFRTINCGHCLNYKITKKNYIKAPCRNCCEHWQFKENKIAKRKENLKKILTDMAIQINGIMTFLENDYLNF